MTAYRVQRSQDQGLRDVVPALPQSACDLGRCLLSLRASSANGSRHAPSGAHPVWSGSASGDHVTVSASCLKHQWDLPLRLWSWAGRGGACPYRQTPANWKGLEMEGSLANRGSLVLREGITLLNLSVDYWSSGFTFRGWAPH